MQKKKFYSYDSLCITAQYEPKIKHIVRKKQIALIFILTCRTVSSFVQYLNAEIPTVG